MVRPRSVRNFNNINDNPGCFNSLISKTESNDMKGKRTANPKLYRSFRFDEEIGNEPYRRNLK